MEMTRRYRNWGLFRRTGACLILLLLVGGLLWPAGAQAKTSKTYKVTFQGSTEVLDLTDYSGLNMRVPAKTKISLPEVPDMEGYNSVGWTTAGEGNFPLYFAGDKVTVGGNLRFYAVRTDKKYASVFLCELSGTCYKAVRVKKGRAYKLPGIANQRGKTVLGWSTKKNQTTAPQYEVGETVKVNRSMRLYPVVFDRSAEKDLTKKQLTRWKSKTVGTTKKFQQVVFVGDSRVYHMRERLKKEFGPSVLDNVGFVCRPGSGLDWFDREGLPQLRALAREGTAVIFNIGVHDLSRAGEYVNYLRKLGTELSRKGCTMFYMSVNPLNNKVMKKVVDRNRPEEKVRAFNAVLRDKLCGGGLFTYIDCYSYLMRSGYGTATTDSDGGDKAKDDGLHYTTKTYKRIFNYCMKALYSYK